MTRRARWSVILVTLAATLAGAWAAFHFATRPTPDPRVAAGSWFIDWGTAAGNARLSRRPILAFFTGSDWCPECQTMQAEVFDTPEFKAWSQQKVVLLLVDIPMKTPLAPEVIARNQALARELGVNIYPTVIFLDPDGQELLRLNYQPGGVKPWLELADGLLRSAKR